eukprot:g6204.t1
MRIIGVLIVLLICAVSRTRANYCEGLFIGSEPGLDDIVKNGRVNDDFMMQAPINPGKNSIGMEVYSSNFYIRKEGKPLKANFTVNHVTSYANALMHPDIKGDLMNKMKSGKGEGIVNSTVSDLIIDYNCITDEYSGGTSMVYINVHADAKDANEACGSGRRGDYFITIIWSKFCGPVMAKDKGLYVGTEESGEDVVSNGEVEKRWKLKEGNRALVVPSSQPSTSFYIQTKDGSRQVFGTPRFEKDDSKLIVQLTSSYDGGIASSKPSMVNVHYLCDIMAKSPVEITMIIDLCAPDVPHEDCNPDRNVGYEPLVIHWIKNCGVEDGSMSMNGAQIFAMTVICVAFILCVATSFLRYKNGKRGAEIFPLGPQLETAFYFVRNFVSSFSTRHAYMRAATQDNEDEEGISLAIGKTKSSNGEVTVRFDSKRSSYQSGSDVISSSGSYGSSGTSTTATIRTSDEDQDLKENNFDEEDI